MKRISVYVKGDRNSTAYYRIYQYFDKIQEQDIKYHIMYPLWVQNRYMPVSKQNKIIQVVVFIAAYIKMSLSLVQDGFFCPDTIVIHKRIISRIMPVSFKLLLNICKLRGCKIVWDFDDHLVEGREMSADTFAWMSKISDVIIVTHEFLKDLVEEKYHDKVAILPTTDGDMCSLFSNDLNKDRCLSLDKELRIIWVATSSNIRNLEPILPFLEEAAIHLKNNTNKSLSLTVVCDKNVNFSSEYLKLVNIRWSRNAAIEAMKTSHVGIMPLADTLYNKGKGGFKLVQYLSIGLPCIGSNVGFNNSVISSDCGFLVSNKDEWVNALLVLSDSKKWLSYSVNAYKQWNDQFSFDNNLTIWENFLNNV